MSLYQVFRFIETGGASVILSKDLEELPWARESLDDSVARWIQVHDRMVEAGFERDDACRAADLEVGIDLVVGDQVACYRPAGQNAPGR